MLTLLISLVTLSQIPPPVHPFAPQGTIIYPTPEDFLAVANHLRALHRLPPLKNDLRILDCAEEYAQINARHKYIDHYHPNQLGQPTDLSWRLAKHNVRFTAAREILCGGPQMLGRDPFALWKDSPYHYTCILSNCTNCGFAVAYDGRGFGYWVGILATPTP